MFTKLLILAQMLNANRGIIRHMYTTRNQRLCLYKASNACCVSSSRLVCLVSSLTWTATARSPPRSWGMPWLNSWENTWTTKRFDAVVREADNNGDGTVDFEGEAWHAFSAYRCSRVTLLCFCSSCRVRQDAVELLRWSSSGRSRYRDITQSINIKDLPPLTMQTSQAFNATRSRWSDLRDRCAIFICVCTCL